MSINVSSVVQMLKMKKKMFTAQLLRIMELDMQTFLFTLVW